MTRTRSIAPERRENAHDRGVLLVTLIICLPVLLAAGLITLMQATS